MRFSPSRCVLLAIAAVVSVAVLVWWFWPRLAPGTLAFGEMQRQQTPPVAVDPTGKPLPVPQVLGEVKRLPLPRGIALPQPAPILPEHVGEVVPFAQWKLDLGKLPPPPPMPSEGVIAVPPPPPLHDTAPVGKMR
jgi:hypothetical protein